MSSFVLARWWQERDRPGWRSFALAMITLAVALMVALYSASLAEEGRLWIASIAAAVALGLAGWVAIAIVPKLARRTSLHWLVYQVNYKITREGLIYLALVSVLVLAAVNTGNNLLFMVLACLLAGILISGVLSRVVLTGLELKLELPEHIFAEQPIVAAVELANQKRMWPSFSLRVVGESKSKKTSSQILTKPVYFPYIPHQSSARQRVELLFPRRGVYRQDTFGIRTKFPFGFLEKTRRVESQLEVVVYPHVAPTEEFFEILPLLSGELVSNYRGRGNELHSIREYVTTDSARFVDWKASAKSGSLKVREFAREDERRLMLVLDPYVGPVEEDLDERARAEMEARFERAVSLCACIAWHFFEIDAVMQFRTDRLETPMTSSPFIIYDVLRELASIQPQTADNGQNFLLSLADQTEVFKIILTNRPQSSIPTALWSSSYFLFLESI